MLTSHRSNQGSNEPEERAMSVTAGLLVTLEAQPGKEADVEEFLNAGRSLSAFQPDGRGLVGGAAWRPGHG
jgi:hypothetical protein